MPAAGTGHRDAGTAWTEAGGPARPPATDRPAIHQADEAADHEAMDGGLRTGHVSRTIARAGHLYHRPMIHDPGAAALLRSVGLLADGPAVWGRPVPAQGPGVFVIELSAPTPTAPSS